ncbi:nucleic acid/nucleotide deaminase domain-containing protein [Lysinibacillus fusiformis]|uniref:nucleic acid/nucleotide deaminase domain-containing protein n=1 Tax=Lysinibacillus fusiformis TaxID=28031 RepID=UPI0037A2F673
MKKVVKKAKAAVTKAKQQVKAAVKQTKQVVKEKVLPVVKKAAQATTKAVKNAVKPKNLLNTLQVGLDLVGLIPGFGEIADGVNGIIYLARGDKVNAALSFGAMIPFAGWVATGGKLVNKGAGVVKSVAEGVQKVLKGPVGSVVDQVKKQVVNVKTQIQSKVAEVKQQLRQMVQSQQDEFSFAGVDRRYIEDTGTVGRNTPTPSPKPSNTQPSQNGSNKKPAEDKGTGNTTNLANPKLPLQVKYGESDLSSMAKNYRIDNQIYDLRNIVVADIEKDGARFSKVFESTERTKVKPSGKVEVKKVHSEKVLVEEKKAAELNGQTYKVHRVYTEREPCILGGHDCKALLKKELPDAEVSYSVEYGDKASRDRGNAELAKELEKLKE